MANERKGEAMQGGKRRGEALPIDGQNDTSRCCYSSRLKNVLDDFCRVSFLQLIRPTLLQQSDVDLLREVNVELVPGFVSGLVLTFNLPVEVKSLSTDTGRVKRLGLPALLPLTLDLETLTAIFIGQLTDWLDLRMLALNPQLLPWFTVANCSTQLQIVVGATSPKDANTLSRLLFSLMAKSQMAQEPQYSYAFPLASGLDAVTAIYNQFFDTVPFTAIAGRAPNTTVLVDVESRLPIKSRSIPGSISYRPLGTTTATGAHDSSVEFQLKIINSEGQAEIVQPTTASLRKCVQKHVLLDDSLVTTSSKTNSELLSGVDAELIQQNIESLMDWSTQQNFVQELAPHPGCYPISTLLSWAVPLQYISTSTSASSVAATCDIGRHAIEFVNYVQTSKMLDGPAETFGLARVASFPIIERMSQSVIYSATCDDEALLIVRPAFYSISSGARSFGIAMTVILLIIAVASTVVVCAYRNHFIMRSSSVPFMLLILVGIGFLSISSTLWSLDPSRGSCMGFQWMACVGFMALFVPLFAKTWRVWRIFSGSQLKVIKISNLKLLMYSSLAIGLDILILIAWSSTSPMKPIEYSNMVNNRMHYYTHCSVDMSSSGAAFVAIEVIYKAGLLIFGAVMAVSTRNVKSVQ